MRDRFFLFILRNRVRYDLIFLYFLCLIGIYYEKSIDFRITLITTILSFLYLSYYEYLVSQKGKIHFFYRGNRLYLLRYYASIQSIKLSLIFLPMTFIACLLFQTFEYFIDVAITVVSFYLSNKLIHLDVEKKSFFKIITVKNLLHSLLLTVTLIFLCLYLLSVV